MRRSFGCGREGGQLVTTTIPSAGPTLTREQCEEAIDAVRDLCEFAYRNGYHELGYNPVDVLAMRLSAEVAPARREWTADEKDAMEYAIGEVECRARYWHNKEQPSKLYCAFRERGCEADRVAATLRRLAGATHIQE